MKKTALLAIGVAILVVAGALAAYFLVYQGSVAIYVKDATGPWSHVFVTVSAVAIHESGKDNASWTTISTKTQTVDLAVLTNMSALLGGARLNPGHYEQIRLSVVNVSGILKGTTASVTIAVPPDNATLKVPGQFTISSAKTTTVTLDILLDASIIPDGSGWAFQPVVHVDAQPPA